MFGRPQQGDANLAQSIRSLNDRLTRLEQGVAGARIIENVALTAGENTIRHGLGRKPSSWWAAAPNGAFPSAGGGGGGGGAFYPEPRATNVSSFEVTPPGSNPLVQTMTFTPTTGRYLVGVFARSSSAQQITSVTQTGVTWTFVARLNPIISTEVYVGQVTGSASSSISLNYTSTNTSRAWHCVAEFSEITSATPTASAAVANRTLSTLRRSIVDSEAIFTTPPVAAAGDLVLFIQDDRSEPAIGSGWDCKAVGGQYSVSGLPDAITIHGRMAPEAKHIRFSGYREDSSTFGNLFMLALPTNISAIGGGSAVTVPHGFREVSSDNENIVIDSVGDVTIDLIVR